MHFTEEDCAAGMSSFLLFSGGTFRSMSDAVELPASSMGIFDFKMVLDRVLG